MPTESIDYSKTIIYKLCCKDLSITDIYIGHTTNFTQRKRQHKYRCNSSNDNFKVYPFIRDNGGWDNWDMVMLEEFSCENQLQATSRERFWMEQLNPTLNMVLPHRTKQEYQNSEKNKQSLKIYYENNKVEIYKKQKLYNEKHKEELKEYFKNYRNLHHEQLREQNKVYREQNKEKIRENKRIKFTCVCGSVCNINDKKQHENTMKHQEYIKNNIS